MEKSVTCSAVSTRQNVTVSTRGVKKNLEADMPAYVRLEMESYPLRALTIMTPSEARALADYLLLAATEAEE